MWFKETKPRNGKKDLTFEKLYYLIIACMNLNGSNPSLPRNFRWFCTFIPLVVTNVGIMYLLGNAVFFIDIPNKDYVEAFKNGFMLMINLSTSYKYSLLLVYKYSLAKLMRVMNEHYSETDSLPPEEKEVVFQYIKKSLTICRIWLVMTLVIGLAYPLKSIILMAYSYLIGEFQTAEVFPVTLDPYLQQQNFVLIFSIQYIFQTLFDYYACVLYIAFEPLIPVLILHACGRLELAKIRLLNVYSDMSEQSVIDQRFRDVVIVLQDVYDFVDEINKMVYILYEISVKVNIVSIPSVLMKVLQGYKNGEMNIEFAVSFVGLFFLTFLPCYYSENLVEKAEEVRLAMYSCQWQNCFDKRNRTIIKFMLARAAKPPTINKIFGIMCLYTFADMCHNSYAIFNLMNV